MAAARAAAAAEAAGAASAAAAAAEGAADGVLHHFFSAVPSYRVETGVEERTEEYRCVLFRADRRASLGKVVFTLESETVAHIKVVTINPAIRGLGFGRLLFLHVCAVLSRAGHVQEVYLEAEENVDRHGRLVNWYASMGFVECVGERGARITYENSANDSQVLRKVPMKCSLALYTKPRAWFSSRDRYVSIHLTTPDGKRIVATEDGEVAIEGSSDVSSSSSSTSAPPAPESMRTLSTAAATGKRVYSTWLMVHVADGTVSFTNGSGKFLCAEPSGRIAANRPWHDLWEMFNVERVDVNGQTFCAMRSFHGSYLCIENGVVRLGASMRHCLLWKPEGVGASTLHGHRFSRLALHASSENDTSDADGDGADTATGTCTGDSDATSPRRFSKSWTTTGGRRNGKRSSRIRPRKASRTTRSPQLGATVLEDNDYAVGGFAALDGETDDAAVVEEKEEEEEEEEEQPMCLQAALSPPQAQHRQDQQPLVGGHHAVAHGDSQEGAKDKERHVAVPAEMEQPLCVGDPDDTDAEADAEAEMDEEVAARLARRGQSTNYRARSFTAPPSFTAGAVAPPPPPPSPPELEDGMDIPVEPKAITFSFAGPLDVSSTTSASSSAAIAPTATLGTELETETQPERMGAPADGGENAEEERQNARLRYRRERAQRRRKRTQWCWMPSEAPMLPHCCVQLYSHVRAYLHKERRYQTLQYVESQRARYLPLQRTKWTTREALEILWTHRDPLHPDHPLTYGEMAVFFAQHVRLMGKPEWMQTAALLFGIGRMMYFSETSTSTDFNELMLGFGPSWVVGAPLPDCLSMPEWNADNADSDDPALSATAQGQYKAHCGLANVLLSWTVHEYAYEWFLQNTHDLPPVALAVVRYFPLWTWYSQNAYAALAPLGGADDGSFEQEAEFRQQTSVFVQLYEEAFEAAAELAPPTVEPSTASSVGASVGGSGGDAVAADAESQHHAAQHHRDHHSADALFQATAASRGRSASDPCAASAKAIGRPDLNQCWDTHLRALVDTYVNTSVFW